jgi:enoyl-CoA hydratase/carnithine racemase
MDLPTYENLRVDVDGALVTLALDDPSASNALTPAMAEGILDLLQRLSRDESTRRAA